jgi:glutathione S-transferase
MATLHHRQLCPQSRFVRLALGEYGIDPALVEERPWERRQGFLELDPSGETPVYVEDIGPGQLVAPGARTIAEYLDETRGLGLGDRRLLPHEPTARIEVRRLMDWFLTKFNAEVTAYLVGEKVDKRFKGTEFGGGAPDTDAIRAGRTNIRYHLRYIGYLIADRNWMAGTDLSYADLAAAAHLSCADYLGDVPWNEDDTAKAWYARVKSRPSFRTLLSDRVPGMAPSAHYENLDF